MNNPKWTYRCEYLASMGYVVWRDIFEGQMKCPLDDATRRDGSRLSEGLGPPPEREAFARWMADTHAPALRRMDADGAHAAGYAAGVAAERERLKRVDSAPRVDPD